MLQFDESTFFRTFDVAAWPVEHGTACQGNLGSFNAQLDARAEMGDIVGAEDARSPRELGYLGV